MKLSLCLFVFLFNVVLIMCQENVDNDREKAIDAIFGSNNGDNPPGLVEVTTAGHGSLEALQKCGEGNDSGKHVCVKYYMCDGITKTVVVVETENTNGFGLIDIRFGQNSCDHPLDVCCGLSPGTDLTNLKEDINPVPVSSGTTSRPTTERPRNSYCGIRNNNGIDFKITGNTDNEAEYGEFPWMVAIVKKNYDPSVDKNLFNCGGSLIAPNVVLTAAHCAQRYQPFEMRVRAGEWDTQTTKERLPYQERDVAEVIVREDFNAQTVYNDVALLLLASPFNDAQHIGTVCLPNQNEGIDSRECLASGWGKDVFGKKGKFQVILKKIELPIVQREQCEEALRSTRLGKFFQLHDSFICAGGEEGKDTCTGDGGSPLVCPDLRNPGRYVQSGIVSWGVGCAENNVPGVYADVAKFRDWIDQQMRRLNIDTKHYTL